METTITLQALIQMGALIMGIWGFYKVIMEIIKNITTRHDREQAWDKAVEDIADEREKLKTEFNSRLDEQDAKIQQLFSMMCMCLRAQDTILEALSVSNIGNGDVKEMRKELTKFISEQMGK